MAVVLPVIHLNGDRKATLVGHLEAAYRAVHHALECLQDGAPNARNYYPQPGLYEQARAQHRWRQAQLQAVLKSLEAEVAGIEAASPTAR